MMMKKVFFSLLLAQQGISGNLNQPNRALLQSIPGEVVVLSNPTTTGNAATTTTAAAQSTTTTAGPETTTTTAPQTTTTTVAPQTTTTAAPQTTTTAAPETTTTAAPQTTTSATTTTAAATTTTTATPITLPPGFEYGSFGQSCPVPAITSDRQCLAIGDILSADQSQVDCQRPGDCCLCQSIECGTSVDAAGNVLPCSALRAGDYGVFGVQDISVFGGEINGVLGASIECVGSEACGQSNIYADTIFGLICDVDRACAQANVVVDNPAPDFELDCNGPESCAGLQLEVNIGEAPPGGMMCNPDTAGTTVVALEGIVCNSRDACKDMQLTINNIGCDKVVLDSIHCQQPGACNGASFAFNGDIDIVDCFCGPSCNFATGLDKCYQNLERLLCPDPRSCLGMVRTIVNPQNGFFWECGGPNSCAHSQLTLQFNGAEALTSVDSLKFGGLAAGEGVTVTFENQQVGTVVTVNRIECGGAQSCEDATFITGENVVVEQVICANPDACAGCVLKVNAADLGTPCLPGGPIVPVTPVQAIVSTTTTAAPASTTTAVPAATTTSAAPVSTTSAPASTTNAPASTTGAPASTTTAAPASTTTAAPASTTTGAPATTAGNVNPFDPFTVTQPAPQTTAVVATPQTTAGSGSPFAQPTVSTQPQPQTTLSGLPPFAVSQTTAAAPQTTAAGPVNPFAVAQPQTTAAGQPVSTVAQGNPFGVPQVPATPATPTTTANAAVPVNPFGVPVNPVPSTPTTTNALSQVNPFGVPQVAINPVPSVPANTQPVNPLNPFGVPQANPQTTQTNVVVPPQTQPVNPLNPFAV